MTRWNFWIDVGGTFTDCVARSPDGVLRQHKTLSSGVVKGRVETGSVGHSISDPLRAQDPDGVWQGYQLLANGQLVGTVSHFESGTLKTSIGSFDVGQSYELISHEPAPLVAIRYLLGKPLSEPLPPIDVRLGTTRGTNALITRTGARTALVATRGFQDVLRIGYQARPNLFALDIRKPDELYERVVEVDERVSADGDVLLELDVAAARRQLITLRESGAESLAIVLLHACANSAHEIQLARVAREVGFERISLSHEIASLRKIVPRGDTTVIDAYLEPILSEYVASIRGALHPESNLDLMTSSGGLVESSLFRGKDSILSGPAGGVVGVAQVAKGLGRSAAIGFDMGGTSTDVSRWDGDFDLVFENEKAGQRIATPMMKIETVAAGGGSLCRFDGVKLTVGPESAGADPGPASYGRGGPLAVTDVNVFLGRIQSDSFPFPLDVAKVESLLTQQCAEVASMTGKKMSPRELAEGYLRIANANMAEAIRCVSFERGVDARDDLLVSFGGAAGQHACAVADELGMKEVVVHPYAGILSAFGIGLSQRTAHAERGIYDLLEHVSGEDLDATFAELEAKGRNELQSSDIDFQHSLDLRFAGLSDTISICRPEDGDYRRAYESQFRSRSGYVPERSSIEIIAARVIARQKSDLASHSVPNQAMAIGDEVVGPAIVSDPLSTIVVDDGWTARCMESGEILLTRGERDRGPEVTIDTDEADPVLLEVFNQRFAAIAQQMGVTLRNTSRSVNVKERLDYSCAIFTSRGELVVNAPHIPVHLGAMGATVRHVLDSIELQPGDVVVTNDPYHGGSHLPDVTVITPVHDADGELLFFTASRAHHAEIGGISPGSMPAFSKNLGEEGKLIRAMKVVDAGRPRFEELKSLLASPPNPSRNPPMNCADINAQIAANRRGADCLLDFVRDYSWKVVAAYMKFIQSAAEAKTRQAIRGLPDGQREFVDHLDDGTPIAVTLTVEDDQATLDFSGTGGVLDGNLNANPAIVSAATLYCLRLLIDEDIPLNEGVLRPVTISIPECLLNPPAHEDEFLCPAIVGGNVETSQRVVDVILGAFGIAAASQGTMNNFLFGNESFGYYETICGGAGATPNGNGAAAVHTHMTNTRLTDPETLERRFPVRLRRFEIRRESGGAGQHRGGDGVVREVEFLAPLHVSMLTQRRGDYLPYGIEGGESGAAGENVLIRKGGQKERLENLASIQVEPGDRVIIKTPGGGGCGAG